jgi:iron complex transport system permease protein
MRPFAASRRSGHRWHIRWPWMLLMLPVCLAVSLYAGRYRISIPVLLDLLTDFKGRPLAVPEEVRLIFWNIRMPRIIMNLAVGGGISMAGVVFQALFRNPLASPDILGVTAGACFGAALSIVFFTQVIVGVQGFAFVFGIAAVSMAYLLASRCWDRSAAVLVISGIVVWAIFQAGLYILMYLANPYDQLAQITFWIMGSFHTASWDRVWTTIPVLVAGSALLTIFSWRLNIMTQAEEQALSLGVNVFRWRFFYVGLSTLMVAAAVAAVGTIAWVGLVIPHIARYLVGSDHKHLVPAAGLIGAAFMLLMDTVARSAFPSEIPISIVTSIFGAPFLGYLMLYRGGVNIGGDSAN